MGGPYFFKARSTISIARSTPAQKPRGWAKITRNMHSLQLGRRTRELGGAVQYPTWQVGYYGSQETHNAPFAYPATGQAVRPKPSRIGSYGTNRQLVVGSRPIECRSEDTVPRTLCASGNKSLAPAKRICTFMALEAHVVDRESLSSSLARLAGEVESALSDLLPVPGGAERGDALRRTGRRQAAAGGAGAGMRRAVRGGAGARGAGGGVGGDAARL